MPNIHKFNEIFHPVKTGDLWNEFSNQTQMLIPSNNYRYALRFIGEVGNFRRQYIDNSKLGIKSDELKAMLTGKYNYDSKDLKKIQFAQQVSNKHLWTRILMGNVFVRRIESLNGEPVHNQIFLKQVVVAQFTRAMFKSFAMNSREMLTGLHAYDIILSPNTNFAQSKFETKHIVISSNKPSYLEPDEIEIIMNNGVYDLKKFTQELNQKTISSPKQGFVYSELNIRKELSKDVLKEFSKHLVSCEEDKEIEFLLDHTDQLEDNDEEISLINTDIF